MVPRPERQIDPEAGPIQSFAAELRQLREGAGSPKYLQMSRASGRSRTALAEAAGGDHLPTWETVEAFVRACGGDVRQWRVRWETAQEAIRPAEPPSRSGAAATVADLPDDAPPLVAGRPAIRRRLRWALLAVVPLGVLLLSVPLALGSRSSEGGGNQAPAAPSAGAPAALVVQNKVAIGPSGLAEDTTPAYLSGRPAPFCAKRGCKVPGTEVWSGAVLVARCQVVGDKITNRDLTSEGIETNPNGVASNIWYEVVLHDGRTGYLSEVYVEARYRGGMGLPICTPR
ncbi:helix-turn-helix transcriptional regulator [Micromonospora harpali]|uniref:Helix-turn-helix domain-containing protein n=1 Tax=Micromonospora harpali TaxID=1490225 RepID=A0ABW1HN16_9ACTN|nr:MULTISPECIES: helix-turn-helix transcriptional regulator [Micromonospora]